MRKRLNPGTTNKARAFRQQMPKAEELLWWKLRALNSRGFNFRRQVPLRGYFADFAEHSARLVIELDGSQHGTDQNHARDALRDRTLNEEGYEILRFSNDEVLRDLQRIVDVIVEAAERRRPPPGSLRSPTSPQGGGD